MPSPNTRETEVHLNNKHVKTQSDLTDSTANRYEHQSSNVV